LNRNIYNISMRKIVLISCVAIALLAACDKKTKSQYAPLEQAGMFSTSMDQLKQSRASDSEIAEIAKLKNTGATDVLCLALFKAAHAHNHDFSSADAAANLSRAGYTDEQIQEMAQSDQIDVLSTDAITLKLIGLSDSAVQQIMHRRVEGKPTLTSEQISRLKNTGMSERQILDLIAQGLSDQQAESEVKRREATRNHANTSFVRQGGRKPR
jgi:hypothetical protein